MKPAGRPFHVAMGCLAAGLALSPLEPSVTLVTAAATAIISSILPERDFSISSKPLMTEAFTSAKSFSVSTCCCEIWSSRVRSGP